MAMKRNTVMFRYAFGIALLSAAPAVADTQGIGGAAWSGAYGGLSFGALRTTAEAERDGFTGDLLALDVQNGLFPDAIEDADTSAIGGLTLGYNRQRGGFVFGPEVDFSFAGVDAENGLSRVDPNPDPLFNGVLTVTGYETEMSGLFTARLRAGYALGDTLLYTTGGLAAGQVENTFSLALPNLAIGPDGYSAAWSDDGTRYGYVVGAGIERIVSKRASIKFDVMYYDLEDVTIRASDPAFFGDNSVDYEFQNSGAIARVGINFRF